MAPHVMIPCLFMRGGTSRGAYFLRDHLPRDRATLDEVLRAVMGSPDSNQIDGLGGASLITSKVALLSRSDDPGVDVEFLFAQVLSTKVDWGPTCGNILAGVGPAAIEMGLIDSAKLGDVETKILVRLVNTGGLVEVVVQTTPGGEVRYDGDLKIDGVPGTAAPVKLKFLNGLVGSKCGGKLLPTGRIRDIIDGVEVTCIDCVVPTVVARAVALGKTGFESIAELDADLAFFRRVEKIRRIAGDRMGLGDVAGRVIPKFAIVAEPRRRRRGIGAVTARYLIGAVTHPSMAVTGAIAISCCSILEGTVAHDVSDRVSPDVANELDHRHTVTVEHPSGELQIVLNAKICNQRSLADDAGPGDVGNIDVYSAVAIRTARLLFAGMIRVPNTVFGNLEGQRLLQCADYHDMNARFCKLFQQPKNVIHKLVHVQATPNSTRVTSSTTASELNAQCLSSLWEQLWWCPPVAASTAELRVPWYYAQLGVIWMHLRKFSP